MILKHWVREVWWVILSQIPKLKTISHQVWINNKLKSFTLFKNFSGFSEKLRGFMTDLDFYKVTNQRTKNKKQCNIINCGFICFCGRIVLINLFILIFEKILKSGPVIVLSHLEKWKKKLKHNHIKNTFGMSLSEAFLLFIKYKLVLKITECFVGVFFFDNLTFLMKLCIDVFSDLVSLSRFLFCQM